MYFKDFIYFKLTFTYWLVMAIKYEGYNSWNTSRKIKGFHFEDI